MATRYYATKRALYNRFYGAAAGDWADLSIYSPWSPAIGGLLLSTVKTNGGTLQTYPNKCNQESDYDFYIQRFVTPPLEAQALTGTLDVCFNVRSRWIDDIDPPSNDSVVRYKIHAYISVGNTPEVRTVILDNYIDADDWPFAAATWTSLAAAQNLTEADIEEGDCIVIEVGCRIVSSPTPSPTYPISHYSDIPFRGQGTTDNVNVAFPDATDGSTTANLAPWIEFSDTLTELAPPGANGNGVCLGAIEIPSLPYQSSDITTVSSGDGDGSGYYKFTAPSTGLLCVSTFGTNYRCAIDILTGVCGSLSTISDFQDNDFANNRSLTFAYAEVEEGIEYYINVYGVSTTSTLSAPACGGVQRIQVFYVDETLENDDIYVPIGTRILVFRDGQLIRIRDLSDPATGCAFDYTEAPMDSLNGGVDTNVRILVGLHNFNLVEIFDAATLNWDEFEVDFIGDPWNPSPHLIHPGQLVINESGLLYAGWFGNGYLFAAGTGTLPSALNTVSSDAAFASIKTIQATSGDNQPGAPFTDTEYEADPEITAPWAIALDEENNIVYYTSGGYYLPVGGQTIKAYDIGSDTQLPDLVTLPAMPGANPGLKGLFRLLNGNFLVCNSTVVHLLDDEGNILQTYTPSVEEDSQQLTDVRATVDQTEFWVIDGATGHMFHFRISDGIEIEDIETFGTPGGFTQFAIFGIPEPPPPANPMSGIYQVVPNKRNDTLWVSFDPEETEDVKIPDPIVKSALFGK